MDISGTRAKQPSFTRFLRGRRNFYGALARRTYSGVPAQVEFERLRLEYVTLESVPDAPEIGTTADVVVAVWIEHSHKRTPYIHSFSPSPPSPI